MIAPVHITCPRGRHERPYLVVQADGRRLRIARVRDLAEAEHLQAKWQQGDYAFNAGEVRRLPPPEKTP